VVGKKKERKKEKVWYVGGGKKKKKKKERNRGRERKEGILGVVKKINILKNRIVKLK
jgi:hypothetical protein